MESLPRIAVVLFNLGGPDRPEAIRPFLFNLFNDPCILRAPAPIRLLLAWLLSAKRARTAAGIYHELGGGSPILPNTMAQAGALEHALNAAGGAAYRVFVAMRYWHPMSDETALAVKEYAPERVILLPLYPQYSTTTTASSLIVWQRAARAAGLSAPSRLVCCYPTEAGFVAALAESVRAALAQAAAQGPARVLFSAHGLPESVIRAGDPYQWQCERTVAAIRAALAPQEIDAVSCYQSRVGPLRWIGPATDDEIRRAGRDRVPVILVPIAFVSEHSETLVELDIEYRRLAEASGVPAYIRLPTVSTAPAFIDGLARLVRQAQSDDRGPYPGSGTRCCPDGRTGCPCARSAGSPAAAA